MVRDWWALRAKSAPLNHSDEQPLHMELASAEQMRQQAGELASRHRLGTAQKRDDLLPRLADNERKLVASYDRISAAVSAKKRISPAGEWILDNFHVIEEQIRLAKRHLPRGYSQELPHLSATDGSEGLPRVYDIALKMISICDGRIDAQNITSFVAAYQEKAVLKLGELWAIPIMLRLALIENLRRVAVKVAVGVHDRTLAERWAQRLLLVAERDPKSIFLVTADMARSEPTLSNSFIAEFVQRLRGHLPAMSIPLSWVEQQLQHTGFTIEETVQFENRQQAANQVSVGASFGSLRFLAAIDWRLFVEELSLVERQLRLDPSNVYLHMDFPTRDQYRHRVEALAKDTGAHEDVVAQSAIELATSATTLAAAVPTPPKSDDAQRQRSHVGYYLVGAGYAELQRRLPPPKLHRHLLRTKLSVPWRFAIYCMAILFGTLVFTGYMMAQLGTPTAPLGVRLTAAFLGFIAISQSVQALVNWLITILIKPRLLPELDFAASIPASARTLVVVPSLLITADHVRALVEDLEVRYLANRDAHLHFALLTDFVDAPAAVMDGDGALLALAVQGIEDLNRRYPGGDGGTFLLLHRERVWNRHDQRWMGYERKRGKIEALNYLLRRHYQPHHGHGFTTIIGDQSRLANIKYVITLDTDSRLPLDTAKHLVGKMAHPLNHPVFDGKLGRITAGYGMMQPRIGEDMAGAHGSWFVRIYGADPGLDPYSRAVSDVYQDLFYEGSFVGKGIYDVDAYMQVLAGQLPENTVLSHDLLEGGYMRCALVSDVTLYEQEPHHHGAALRRRHRWIRGDWQILPWLGPWLPGGRPNPLSVLSRWKIFDNLRRCLVPLATLLLLVVGWLGLQAAGPITVFVLAILIVPQIFTLLATSLRHLPEVGYLERFSDSLQTIHRYSVQAFLLIVFLPYDAYVNTHALLTASWRMVVTKRALLEWQAQTDPRYSRARSLWDFYQTGMITVVITAATAALVLWLGREDWVIASPFLLLWALSPAMAWWLSRPLRTAAAPLDQTQTQFLELLSRRTWRFFETFVTAADNWLPPDNFQEYPVAVLARRTSPTNIGLALLSNLAAYDFGYLTAAAMLKRTEQTFCSLEKMQRFRGHFFNWYDTQTLEPLLPQYVSTVDSGNLVGFLLTLKAGLHELSKQAVLSERLAAGLNDTLSALYEALEQACRQRQQPLPARLTAATSLGQRLASCLAAQPPDLRQLVPLAAEGQALLTQLVRAIDDFGDVGSHWWVNAYQRQFTECLVDVLKNDLPWLELPAPSPAATSHLVQAAGNADALRLVALYATAEALPTWGELSVQATAAVTIEAAADEARKSGDDGASSWLLQLAAAVRKAAQNAQIQCRSATLLAEQCRAFDTLEYDFLYDKSRHLLSIGYAVADHRRDSGFYDLLASEARLASFIGIAKGLLPQQHWFALGRLLTQVKGGSALLSWSGSMFEYLMPLLVMPNYPGSLLDRTYRNVVSRQIEYGKQRGIPWGISESGYNTTDMNLNYQYRAFGVPGLGFKRGLADDLVVAPYAATMALMVDPAAATANLQVLANKEFFGRYGCYEAIDYTRTRLVQGQNQALLRSFMAHHQGMSFLSLAYHLLGQPMQRRFMADPQVQATELLLQERVPKFMPFYPHAPEVEGVSRPVAEKEASLRIIPTAYTPRPEVQLLSNGRYTVMVTQAGGGYSRWQGLALTRWREDPSCDDWGSFCYVRDITSGAVWSAAHQPARAQATHYEAIFPLARAEFRRLDHGIEMHTEIAVSPEDDVELRRLTLTNLSKEHRTLELTSYAEIVLAPQSADEAHAAFSNLFVQTEVLSDKQAILASRRPRSDLEQTPTLLHLLSLHDSPGSNVSFETDRARFIGRGQSTANPAALASPPGVGMPLSGQDGSVLDPIMAIRCQITLAPEASVQLHYVTGVATTRDLALQLVGKYHDRSVADRVFEMAWTHSQVVLRQFNIEESDAHLYVRLASAVLYANPQLRGKRAVLSKNNRRQADLWGYGISGDLPIVLLRVGSQEHLEIVGQMVQAHSYWRMMGLAVDLIIWNEDDSGYRQVLHEQIMAVITAGCASHLVDKNGGLFVRRSDQIPEDDQVLFQTIARAIITDSNGTLAEQMLRHGSKLRPLMPLLLPSKLAEPAEPETPLTPDPSTLFDNGLGAFSSDGREYIISSRHHHTPAPWSNVLANPYFGSVISESGSSYSWCENAHEFRLTPWYNDAITDRSGEAYYLRDESSGALWSPTPLPTRAAATYVTTHGFGYTSFKVKHQGIASELTVFVAIDAPIKLALLKLRNDSSDTRLLTLTAYSEWVLGELRPNSLMHVITEHDLATDALFARNPYHGEFGGRIGFLSASEPLLSLTCDRSEFIGRNGTNAQPEGLRRTRLSGRVGPGIDACAAAQIAITLAPGAEQEVVIALGVGRDVDDARTLINRFLGVAAAHTALDEVKAFWRDILGAVQIETPDLATNVLCNGWLLYQVIASRIWARSGYYQSGGAFGFRDQLQDTMALLHAQPSFLRVQILRCAAHQYRAGDVQHWWHPPSNRGVRTHFSDDYLWLPFATCRYVQSTADTGILDVRAHFLEGRNVMPDEEAYMDLPHVSHDSATLYEHCVVAIERALRFGQHGLPLMGCGDWNDGMNLVGAHGKGESVWLAFFLYDILTQFAAVARIRADHAFADKCLREAVSLQERIEANAWDGAWYRRAYFDDGTPLGTAAASECQIDALPQSWAVLSGAARPARAKQAMAMTYQRLVDQEHGIIKLFDPPFDKSLPNPGYIKGYVPGVRENGGQYTHAAVWTAMAFAGLGDAKTAWQLLSLINPINHARDRAALEQYRAEPYVMAADVYAVAPHIGRGGWTWYTGSAGWTYRLIVESLLGLNLKANHLSFAPCVPAEWTEYKLRYRYRQTYYQITVHLQSTGDDQIRIVLDGTQTPAAGLLLHDDHMEHQVDVYIPNPRASNSQTEVCALSQ